MKSFFKYFFIFLFFFFVLLVFLPKEKIYYYFIDDLKKEKITISHKSIENKFLGLLLGDVTFRYSGIKMAISDNIDISSYILKSSIIINNTRIDSILSKFIPIDIYSIEITHSLYNYNKLYISSKFNGGALIGYINLSNEKIFLKMKLSKEFEKKYKLIMVNLKKDKNGLYYIYEYNPDKTFKKIDIQKKDNITLEKEKIIVKKKIVVKKNIFNIDNDIVLKAIYSDGGNGWVVVSKNTLSSTSTLNIGDSFNNYKLKKVFNTFAIFTRENNEYKIYLVDNKTKFEKIDKKIVNSDDSTTNNLNTKKQLVVFSEEIELNIDNSKEIVKVNKILINSYKNNFKKIWDEINIDEIKNLNKLDGFRISSVSSKSVFNKLGLKKDDIIKAVNGTELTSYIDAFKVYNSINTVKKINIGIVRDGKNMELKYEIK